MRGNALRINHVNKLNGNVGKLFWGVCCFEYVTDRVDALSDIGTPTKPLFGHYPYNYTIILYTISYTKYTITHTVT